MAKMIRELNINVGAHTGNRVFLASAFLGATLSQK